MCLQPKSPLHRLTPGRVQELVDLRRARALFDNALDENDNDDEALADGHDANIFDTNADQAADDNEVELMDSGGLSDNECKFHICRQAAAQSLHRFSQTHSFCILASQRRHALL
jgi:hypothetical protein